ncbi:hypothetical protein EUX98_g6813 [Antrodiella citrinella]|uniref:Uncharacterized protein n=1 Tax=Antrodiella citrinella TaxID=2447956 RepID=A0A4S4MN35_9APHY|nr:hypothetical protein EUX98_g6813 [Antrodiella citrinella]
MRLSLDTPLIDNILEVQRNVDDDNDNVDNDNDNVDDDNDNVVDIQSKDVVALYPSMAQASGLFGSRASGQLDTFFELIREALPDDRTLAERNARHLREDNQIVRNDSLVNSAIMDPVIAPHAFDEGGLLFGISLDAVANDLTPFDWDFLDTLDWSDTATAGQITRQSTATGHVDQDDASACAPATGRELAAVPSYSGEPTAANASFEQMLEASGFIENYNMGFNDATIYRPAPDVAGPSNAVASSSHIPIERSATELIFGHTGEFVPPIPPHIAERSSLQYYVRCRRVDVPQRMWPKFPTYMQFCLNNGHRGILLRDITFEELPFTMIESGHQLVKPLLEIDTMQLEIVWPGYAPCTHYIWIDERTTRSMLLLDIVKKVNKWMFFASQQEVVAPGQEMWNLHPKKGRYIPWESVFLTSIRATDFVKKCTTWVAEFQVDADVMREKSV